MRLRACLAIGLAALAISAPAKGVANGILVVPVVITKQVQVTSYVQGYTWRFCGGREWRYVPTLIPTVRTAPVNEKAFVIVPDPKRPCFRPPPPPPPGGISPSRQSISTPLDAPAPSGRHEHAEGKDEGCGSCFPDCFLKPTCTCCAHNVVVLEEGSDEAR